MDSIDDKEDMQFADEAFDILGFSSEEKYNVYKARLCFFNIFLRPGRLSSVQRQTDYLLTFKAFNLRRVCQRNIVPAT